MNIFTLDDVKLEIKLYSIKQIRIYNSITKKKIFLLFKIIFMSKEKIVGWTNNMQFKTKNYFKKLLKLN